MMYKTIFSDRVYLTSPWAYAILCLGKRITVVHTGQPKAKNPKVSQTFGFFYSVFMVA